MVRFAVKEAKGISFVDYAQLDLSTRPKIADVVMQLDSDWEFGEKVQFGIAGKQRRIIVMANAFGYIRTVPFKPLSGNRWSQKRVDKVHILELPIALCAREAIARHDELVGVVRLWRFVLETFFQDIPCLNSPNVGDLLGCPK
ncbi:MAG: hypothetical protein ACU0B7_00945 [Paracoccaceae bacterium]